MGSLGPWARRAVMRARSLGLRARVAAAAAAAIVLAVALLGVAVLAVLRHELAGSLDRTLRARAVDVARLAASATCCGSP